MEEGMMYDIGYWQDQVAGNNKISRKDAAEIMQDLSFHDRLRLADSLTSLSAEDVAYLYDIADINWLAGIEGSSKLLPHIGIKDLGTCARDGLKAALPELDQKIFHTQLCLSCYERYF